MRFSLLLTLSCFFGIAFGHYHPQHQGQQHKLRQDSQQVGITHHGHLTLAGISGNRPHCLILWLDGSIIVGYRGYCNPAPPQGSLSSDVLARHL